MGSSSNAPRAWRFGAFEVDLQSGLVRKHGIRLRIQQQPLRILASLLARPGEVVTREELRQTLWPSDTHVDFEQGLNSAITRLRQVLSDSADTPRFIETHSRLGYRFIAPVEAIVTAPSANPSFSPPEPAAIPVAPKAVPSHSHRRLPLALGTAALVPLAFAAVWWFSAHASQPATSLQRPIPLTSYAGLEATPSFSPDGNQIAFEWDQGEDEPHIFIKLVGQGEPLRLTTGVEAEYGPAWSPDGRQIAFIRGLNKPKISVFVVPALGGVEQKVGEFGSSYSVIPYTTSATSRWLAWTPDSKHLIVSGTDDPGTGRGLFLLSKETGGRDELTLLRASGEAVDRSPAVSPDGRNVAFCRMSSTLVGEIYVAPLSTHAEDGQPHRLTTDGRYCASPTWSPDGRSIVFQSNRDGDTALWRVNIDGSSAPLRLTAAGTDVYDPVISPRGRLAYTRRFVDSNIWVQSVYPKPEPPVSLLTSTAEDRNPQYSPVDGRIAFQSWRSGNPEIWVCGNTGTLCTQLTSMNGPHTGSPRWSPDGKWIAFDSAGAGNFDIYVVDANGGPPRRLTGDPSEDSIPSWSADGKSIYFQSIRTGSAQIWKAPASGGTAIQITRSGGFTAFESPDGRTLYYTKQNHVSKLWKSAPDGSGETELLDAVLMRGFVAKNDRIYYLHPETGGAVGLRCLMLITGGNLLLGQTAKPVSLGLAVTADDKQIAYSQIDQRGSDLMLLDNFR